MDTAICQLKVRLIGTRPAVWRRFQVPADVHLHKLHLILQAVMGWANYHLYRFEVGDTEYGELHPDNEFYELHFVDSHRSRLNSVVPGEKARLIYDYDFGDGWRHEVTVEKNLPAEAGIKYPVCLAGERACPPEDCGGIGGYAELLRIIRNPRHEEYEEMLGWLGGHFDPEEFDLDRVNRSLGRFRPRRRRTQSAVPDSFRRAFEEKEGGS